ncbi:molybdate ABC transporter inner membrane subunit [Candidatus Magnetoovum chiemensis]|nr:molybdate ABC transporter inner membrane subunit [Candidatus Magnetoovum chiemensis]
MFLDGWLDSGLWFSLKLSLKVALTATVFIVLAGVTIAYFLAMRRFRGKELLDIILTLPLVLPPTVTGYYLIVIFGRKGFIGQYIFQWTGWSFMFNWYGAALASFVVALPLMIKASRAAIESVDKDLINASYTLGCGELETAFRITIPLAKRGITAAAILSFTRAMGEFGATLMIAGNIPGKTDTMPIAIYSLASSGEWNKANMAVFALTAMSGFFLFLANKYSKGRGAGS